MEKIKAFLKKNKKWIVSLLIILSIMVIVSVVTFLLLLAFNVVYFDDGMRFNTELFDSFKTSWYGWIIFILLQTFLSMLLCVIPGASMAFIILAQTIYPIPWQAFLLSFISVMISSVVMYFMGRVGGYKICTKILGEADCEKASSLLRHKGTIFFPLMMMFPMFPDDALVMIAGTIKMKLRWFIPSIVFGRGIGIATITFGFSIVPFDKFTTFWHWAGFILICLSLVFVIFYFANKLNNYLEKRHNEKEASKDE